MVTPGEAVVRVQQAELQQSKANGLALRKQLESVSKELAVCKQQLHVTQKALHNAELAKGTHQEYSRHMEQQLEKSGKGVALLKAAKLQSELEFLQKENSVLFHDLQSKGQEVKTLLGELGRQRDLVDQAAQGVGLPSRQLLEELVELRQQFSAMSDTLLEKEAVLKRQQLDLQDFHLYRSQYKQLEGKVTDLQTALEAAEGDKATLLDFIQESEARLASDREGAMAAEAAARAREAEARGKEKAATTQVEELQRLVKEQLKLLHQSQGSCSSLEKEGQALRTRLAQATEECAQLQAQHQATVKQQGALSDELKRMQDLIKGVLDPSEAEHVQLNGAINSHTHRVMSAMAATPSPSKKSPGPRAAPASTTTPSQVMTSLSCVSRQLEVLVTQHTRLQQAWQKAGGIQRDNDKLKQTVFDQESLLAAAAGRQSQLEAELAAGDGQWRRLSGVLRGREGLGDPGRPTETHVPGREQELVAAVEARLHAGREALSTALSQVGLARDESAGLRAALGAAGEERGRLGALLTAADQERATCDARLQEMQTELRHTRSELDARPTAEQLEGLMGHVATLESQLDAAHQQMSSLLASHQSELRNAERAHAATQAEACHLRKQLQHCRLECEQLTLRAVAAQEALVQQEEDLLRYKAANVKHLLRGSARSTPGPGPCSAMLAAAATQAHTAATGDWDRPSSLVAAGQAICTALEATPAVQLPRTRRPLTDQSSDDELKQEARHRHGTCTRRRDTRHVADQAIGGHRDCESSSTGSEPQTSDRYQAQQTERERLKATMLHVTSLVARAAESSGGHGGGARGGVHAGEQGLHGKPAAAAATGGRHVAEHAGHGRAAVMNGGAAPAGSRLVAAAAAVGHIANGMQSTKDRLDALAASYKQIRKHIA